MNAEILNDKALETLNNGDYNWHDAQPLFRKNVEKNPSVMTFNNLGVFYLEFGMMLANGKVQNADKLGLRYLKKAASTAKSYTNLMALGDYYLQPQLLDFADYYNAEKYYKQAADINETTDVMINLGGIYFMQKRYAEASAVYEQVSLSPDYQDDQNMHRLSYAFSLVYNNQPLNSQKINAIVKFLGLTDDPDVFALAYLNEDMNLAERFINNIFNVFLYHIPIIAMAVDCLLKLDKYIEAENLINLQIKAFEENEFPDKQDIIILSQISDNPIVRKKQISNYEYIPKFARPCYFIGCKKHNCLSPTTT